MKNLVYLFSLFLFVVGSSFTNDFHRGTNYPLKDRVQLLAVDVKLEQPQSATSTDGAIRVTVSGGVAPYTIQVVSTYSPSQIYTKDRIDLKKLGVGNYIIMVQDAEKHVLQKTIELTAAQ